MSEPLTDRPDLSLEAQRGRIDQLAQLIAERGRAESSLRGSLKARESTAAAQFAADRARLTALIAREKQQQQARHTRELAAIVNDFENGVAHAAADHDRVARDVEKETAAASLACRRQCQADRERVQEDCNEQLRDAQANLQSFHHKLESQREDLERHDLAMWRVVRRRRCRRAFERQPEIVGEVDSANPLERFAGQVEAARQELARFPSHWPARLSTWWSLLIVFSSALAVATVTGVVLDPEIQSFIDFPQWVQGSHGAAWMIASTGVSLGLACLVFVALRPTVVHQTIRVARQCKQHLANAHTALDAARTVAVAEADQIRQGLRSRLDQEHLALGLRRNQALEKLNATRESKLRENRERLQARRQELEAARDSRQDDSTRRFEIERRELHEACESRLAELDQRAQSEQQASREAFDRGWHRLVTRWHAGLAEVAASVDAMNAYCSERFPAWDAVDWQSWSPPDPHLTALRFGEFRVSLEMFEQGIPESPELRPSRTEFQLPALISFTTRPSLLYEAWGDGREAASTSMQDVMLRLLTSLPAGKTRFTIIDPIGRGQNFSAFMHLADFEERLVSHRIWTESQHIDQRLADLTEHMEDVIQTYLRNEFATIDEYNRHAGEVAEPFHVLVVANFPAGFSDEAASRLLSVVRGGARCGVYSLIGVDTKLELPRNFDLADLESYASSLQWNGTRFCWLDEDVKDLPLTLDQPPDQARFTEIVRVAGRRAVEANRVEVPFSTVAVAEDRWWTADSRAGIDVPLGRAGATKLQHLQLGSGTSQHVLISGKTGSGKSTLLHALITNAAIRYSPDELQFFLIDFKKGVEFKAYASLKLPHARVVAIESEREFGMSVLQRLDDELRVRGDLFRKHGVQDIRNFRDANPDLTLPRLLLVIDEFQEFFVVDDRLAQDAALLLDRLVRQGRAFGIHVLLGSQTLAGAYSLARSTIGQMAVRIALQCSEADSHLILSEDNTAARLLNRPGEAIYNDANGLFEGNHPFQVVWLPPREQEQYLNRLALLADQRQVQIEPAIVFEGSAPGDPQENEPLRKALAADHPKSPLAPTAWLGAAAAIKDPTSALLRRQSGSHLLVVGQQEGAALGLLATSLIGLAATTAGGWHNGNGNGSDDAPAAEDSQAEDSQAEVRVAGDSLRSNQGVPCFYIFDGSRSEAPEAEFWRRLAANLPLDIRMVTPRDVAPSVAEIAAEVDRRVDTSDDTAPPIFVLVYHLARFRDLRRREDDFSFSSGGDGDDFGADKQFATILREGPAHGVHALIWSDTYNSLTRAFDRLTLRELDCRVLFQMSANDSSNLMDSPAASRLGVHRAILFSEEQGTQEKFRPYGPPTADWLAWVQDRLRQRAATAPAG